MLEDAAHSGPTAFPSTCRSLATAIHRPAIPGGPDQPSFAGDNPPNFDGALFQGASRAGKGWGIIYDGAADELFGRGGSTLPLAHEFGHLPPSAPPQPTPTALSAAAKQDDVRWAISEIRPGRASGECLRR